MIDLATNSFGFNAGTVYPNSQNYARFEVLTDFSVGNPVDMIPTNHSPLTLASRQQIVQVRDIVAFAYLPTCVPDGQEFPQFSSTPIVGLYQTYTFQIRINDQNTQFSAIFTKNCDQQRSRLVLSTFETIVNTLTVKVQRDYIDPVWNAAGVNVQLGLIIEFNCYNK